MEFSVLLYIAIGIVVIYKSDCYERRYFRGKNDVSGTANLILVMLWPLVLVIISVTIIYQFIKSLFK